MNKKVVCLSICFVFVISGFQGAYAHDLSIQNHLQKQNSELAEKTSHQIEVLVVLPNNYGANFFLNRDIFNSYGWNVTLAAATDSVKACPVYAEPLGCPVIEVDQKLSEISDISAYDCVAIMSASHWSSNPCQDLISSEEMLNIINQAIQNNIIVGAWCTAVRVLAAADVLNGVNVTGNNYYQSEYTAAGAIFNPSPHRPVIDGQIVTCVNGDFYCQQNCQALEKAIRLCREETKAFFGGELHDGASAAINMDDACLCIGYTRSQGNGGADGYLCCTDATSQLRWERTIGSVGDEFFFDGIVTSDGGFLCVGSSTSNIEEGKGKDVFLVKTDGWGHPLWQQFYGGFDDDQASSVVELSDGIFLVAGTTSSFGYGQEDFYVICIDEFGEMLWSETYGTSGSDIASKIISRKDGSFSVVGTTGSFSPQGWGNRDILIIDIDEKGSLLDYCFVGEPSYHNWASDAIETSDGGLLIVGSADITYENLYDMYAVRLDSNDAVQWEKRFGFGSFYDFGSSVLKLSEDSYLLAGTTKSIDSDNDVYLQAIDDNAQPLWNLTYRGFLNDWCNDICIRDDSSIWFAGYSSSCGAGSFDVLVMSAPIAGNSCPDKPSTPEGTKIIDIDYPYIFSSKGSDPNGDEIYYLFDWGDGSDSGWIGPFQTIDALHITHGYDDYGMYKIKVKTKDPWGIESEWSDCLVVYAPENTGPFWDIINSIYLWFYTFFEK